MAEEGAMQLTGGRSTMRQPGGSSAQLAGSPAQPVAVNGASAAEPRLTRRRLAQRTGLLIVTVVALGVLAAVAWKLSAPLPSVTVAGDGTAAVTNRTMAEFFGSDADFMIIGMFAGLGLGALCWRWLKTVGWLVAFVAAFCGILGALVAWRTGVLLGPNDFADRLARASSGQQVSIDLALRTPTAWLSWPLGAVLSVLLYSSFGGGDGRPLFRRPRPVRSGRDEETGGATRAPRPAHRSVRFPSPRAARDEPLSRTDRQSAPQSLSTDHSPRSRR